jgi:hypothetical protein
LIEARTALQCKQASPAAIAPSWMLKEKSPEGDLETMPGDKNKK